MKASGVQETISTIQALYPVSPPYMSQVEVRVAKWKGLAPLLYSLSNCLTLPRLDGGGPGINDLP